MEGLLLEEGALTLGIAYGAFVILALAVAGVVFGSMSERERHGESITWAAEPIPETRESEDRTESRIPLAA